jgi:hypothetical protein
MKLFKWLFERCEHKYVKGEVPGAQKNVIRHRCVKCGHKRYTFSGEG